MESNKDERDAGREIERERQRTRKRERGESRGEQRKATRATNGKRLLATPLSPRRCATVKTHRNTPRGAEWS